MLRDGRMNERLQKKALQPGGLHPRRFPHFVGFEILSMIVEGDTLAQSVAHSCMIEVVPSWLERLLRKPDEAPPPLRGAPAAPRMKNYAALSGYAYEYVFEGHREWAGAREYVFRISGDRKTWSYLPVRLQHKALNEWEAANGRPLRDNEKYAAAKLALFSAFDERANPEAMRQPVEVDGAALTHLLQQVGIE